MSKIKTRARPNRALPHRHLHLDRIGLAELLNILNTRDKRAYRSGRQQPGAEGGTVNPHRAGQKHEKAEHKERGLALPHLVDPHFIGFYLELQSDHRDEYFPDQDERKRPKQHRILLEPNDIFSPQQYDATPDQCQVAGDVELLPKIRHDSPPASQASIDEISCRQKSERARCCPRTHEIIERPHKWNQKDSGSRDVVWLPGGWNDP